MGSVQSVENFDPAIGGPVAGHGTANNICGVIEEGASSEQNIGAGEGSKASDGADNQSTVVGAPATADEVPENSTCSSHGWFSMMGRRRVMEDTVMVAPGAVAPYDFFAVYDGHGGARVALACRERMHKLLVKEIEGYADGGGGGGGGGRSSGGGEEEMIDWEKVMVACFAKMDGEVRGGGGERVEMEDVASAGQMIGSTAVVVVVGKEEVVTANCGDSRAVLCRGGVAVPLSCDHKPDRPDERERVEAAGGRIINWNGSRVLGVLATSRSIGDQYLRPYVIPIPEVTVSKRTDLDEFLVIASDGLWDVVSNEVACEVTKRCLCGQIRRRFLEGLAGSCAADAAAVLAELAMVRGSKDNISVIVVELKKTSHIV